MLNYIKIRGCFIAVFDEDILLYNTYTFATCIIENYKSKLKVNSVYDYYFEKNIISFFKEENQILYDSFFSDIKTNRAIANYYSNQFKYQRKMLITDCVSFSCNMDCVYCFEYGFSESGNELSKDNRKKLMLKLIELYSEQIDDIDYIFFGGEPLLHIKYIEDICRTFTKEKTEKKLSFSFTTNGTLINDKFISLCRNYNIKELRITLDGPEYIHDNRRPLKNKNGSYSKIIENIKRLCEDTNTNIIINTVIDDNNYKYYINMFDSLLAKLAKYILVEPVRIIFNIGTTCTPMLKKDESKECFNIDGTSSNYYDLAKSLLKRGATITSPFYAGHCLNSSEKSFFISPKGDIYKCITGSNHEKFLASSYLAFFEEPMQFIKNNIVISEGSHMNKCRECEFLTICNGGCKFQHLINGATLCRKETIYEELPHLLDLLYIGEFDNDGNFKKRKAIY